MGPIAPLFPFDVELGRVPGVLCPALSRHRLFFGFVVDVVVVVTFVDVVIVLGVEL